jgi:hypothetical protein
MLANEIAQGDSLNDDWMVSVEDSLEEIKAELVALRHTVTAITLALFAADATTIERIHHQLIELAIVERRPGSERAERKAAATEVLADRLLMAARQAVSPSFRANDSGDG